LIKTKLRKHGPIFSPNRDLLVRAAMTKSMRESVLLGEREIKSGYKASPGPNRVGGRRTSHLSRGIRGQVHSPFKADIQPGKYVYGANVPYAEYVELGRRASSQKVKPTKGRALRFRFRGETGYNFRAYTRPFRTALIGNPMFKKTADKFRKPNSKLKKIFVKNLTKVLD
tara:strand:- start:720 stop:1229 length:510 start_codon:yes stop_codon:yes gene_type:complete